MKILFFQGWHGVPGSVKPAYLKDYGHEVINPALDDDDFVEAVATAQAVYDQSTPDVIVGESRGGTVAMNIRSNQTPLVLLCPGWKRWGSAKTVKLGTVILHSKDDDIVPFADSEELVRNSGLPASALIEVGSDHWLSDEAPLSVMLWVCGVLASGNQLPWLDEDSPPTRFGKNKVTSQKEASYVCDACGEEIVIPLDLTEGSHQTYVEDCPVCCRANIIHVEVDEDGDARVWAEPE